MATFQILARHFNPNPISKERLDMKIKTKNDMKGKHQSWSADIEPVDIIEGGIYVNAGYGWTEEEAIAELKENVRKLHLKWSSVVAETLM